jgi:hypothetical protein
MATAEPTEEVFIEGLGDQLANVVGWLPESWLPYWTMLAEYPLLGALGLAVVFYVLALASRLFFVMFLADIRNDYINS